MPFRLSLVSALLTGAVVLLLAGHNWAQNSNELDVQFHAFQDSRGVTVLSPTVDLTRDFTDRTTLRVNYGVDAISAASDSCARCHRNGVHSRRQVASLGITRKYDDWKLTIGGAFSKENFYRATTGSTSLSRDMANGNTTVAGGYSFSLNQPMVHPMPDYETQYQHDLSVSVTQTLSKTTIGQVGYEYEHLNGYLNNPFLRANVSGVMVLGQVPDTRSRNSLMLRLRQALPSATYLEADVRHYRDSWQVNSNSATVGLSHHFGPTVLGAFSYRWYNQSGAFFYKPQYETIPQYYTADFRLEPFTSSLVTGKIVITPKGQMFWFPEGTGLSLQYERYHGDNSFDAGIFSAGLVIPLGAKK